MSRIFSAGNILLDLLVRFELASSDPCTSASGSLCDLKLTYAIPTVLCPYRNQPTVEMLSNLASYLMGAGPTVPVGAATPTTSSAAPTEIAQGKVIAQQELHCIEEEDWLLVHPDDDRTDRGSSGTSDETSADSFTKGASTVRF